MKRGELQRLIEGFVAGGGAVARLPEGAVSVDWSDGPVRQALRAQARAGHDKRWGARAA